MKTPDVLDGFTALLAAEIENLDRDGVAALVASSARLRAWHDSVDLRCARRIRELQAAGQAESPAALFGRDGQRSSKDGGALERRAEVSEQMPSLHEGLENGKVSSGHLDAIASVRSRLDAETRDDFDSYESDIAAAAATTSVDQFARELRDLARTLTPAMSDADELDKQRAASNVKRWVDRVTGMHHTHLEVDPLRDATLWTAVNDSLATLKQLDGNAGTPWQQLQVNAVVAAVQGGAIADESAAPTPAAVVDPVEESLRRIEKRIPEVTVLTDLAVLLDGLHDGGICETDDGIALPVSTVRRLCCDAEIIPAVLGAAGEILDLGRAVRTVNRAQRRALRAMHRTCAHPECTVPFSNCKAHHIRWWKRDQGPTDISNLLPLCEKHHHLVHEGRWTLTMTPDRVATWTRPDGTVHHVGCSIDRRPSRPGAAPAQLRRDRACDSVSDRRPNNRPMIS